MSMTTTVETDCYRSFTDQIFVTVQRCACCCSGLHFLRTRAVARSQVAHFNVTKDRARPYCAVEILHESLRDFSSSEESIPSGKWKYGGEEGEPVMIP
jgi:hypothetical protein